MAEEGADEGAEIRTIDVKEARAAVVRRDVETTINKEEQPLLLTMNRRRLLDPSESDSEIAARPLRRRLLQSRKKLSGRCRRF